MIDAIQISDDGMRVVVTCAQQGVLLGSRHRDEPAWQLLYPSTESPFDFAADESDGDDEIAFSGDMVHAAIARDGRLVALGEQSSPHYVLEIGTAGRPSWYATVGNLSEYPHHACFSGEGSWVALNSCHFYSGATRAFDHGRGRGAQLEPYEHHELAPAIDGDLRVYASCWLPSGCVGETIRGATALGAFALAGCGVLRGVTPRGELAFVQGFGSSASSMDVCPVSRRMALASYSGFIHVYDPFEEELPGRIDGVRARREIKRWVMWEHLAAGPIAW
jgi:hypothetical protein